MRKHLGKNAEVSKLLKELMTGTMHGPVTHAEQNISKILVRYWQNISNINKQNMSKIRAKNMSKMQGKGQAKYKQNTSKIREKSSED